MSFSPDGNSPPTDTCRPLLKRTLLPSRPAMPACSSVTDMTGVVGITGTGAGAVGLLPVASVPSCRAFTIAAAVAVNSPGTLTEFCAAIFGGGVDILGEADGTRVVTGGEALTGANWVVKADAADTDGAMAATTGAAAWLLGTAFVELANSREPCSTALMAVPGVSILGSLLPLVANPAVEASI